MRHKELIKKVNENKFTNVEAEMSQLEFQAAGGPGRCKESITL